MVRNLGVARSERAREAASRHLSGDRETLIKPVTTGGARSAALLAATLLIAVATLGSAPDRAAAAPAPAGFFGVNTPSALPAHDYVMMQATDVGIVRTEFLLSAAKTKPGEPYDWSRFDALLAGSADNGMDLNPVLYGVPPWISTERRAIPFDTSVAEWRKFLTNLVERYGPEGEYWALHPEIPFHPITDWQVWNEPNSRTWWSPKPDPKQYGKLLVLSAKAIHSVDPGARIMTAGIVAEPTNTAAIKGNEFLSALFKSKAVRAATDVVSFHPYAPTTRAVQAQLESLRKTLRKAKMSKTPIWITEVGWGSEGPKNHPLIMPEPTLEREFGDLLEMVVDQRRRLGLERLLWYHWQDRPDDLCLWCESSGLIDQAGEPKPLLDIFKAIARI